MAWIRYGEPIKQEIKTENTTEKKETVKKSNSTSKRTTNKANV